MTNFVPRTMEQDMYTAYKADQAAKFGYDPASSDAAQVIAVINKAVFILNSIYAAIVAFTGIGFPIGLALQFINVVLFKIVEGWTAILDINNLLSRADRKEILALVAESKFLSQEAKKYKTFGEMPGELQDRIKAYMKKNYAATNSMKDALKKVAAAHS